MSKTEESLMHVTEWIFNHGNENTVLKIGFWDIVDYSFYAIIETGSGMIMAGENTYGSSTIEEALADLVKNLSGKDGK